MWKNSNYFHRRYCSTMSSILHSCVLIILIVSVNGNWEKIGERILNKISKLSRASNQGSRRFRHQGESLNVKMLVGVKGAFSVIA